MANAFTQLYVHYVFATRERCPLLKNQYQKQIFAYLVGKAKEHECFVKAIGGTDDHIHLLVTLDAKISISEFAKVLKGSSSHYINDMKISPKHFEWQVGYGAFSVSQSSVAKVVNYIRNQVEHHHKVSFQDEFIALLQKYQVKYEQKYVFETVE
jgi:putative transposase